MRLVSPTPHGLEARPLGLCMRNSLEAAVDPVISKWKTQLATKRVLAYSSLFR